MSNLDYLIDLVNRRGVSIEQLEKYIFEKVNQLKQLDKDIQDMTKNRSDMASIYKLQFLIWRNFNSLDQFMKSFFKQKMRIRKKIF